MSYFNEVSQSKKIKDNVNLSRNLIEVFVNDNVDSFLEYDEIIKSDFFTPFNEDYALEFINEVDYEILASENYYLNYYDLVSLKLKELSTVELVKILYNTYEKYKDEISIDDEKYEYIISLPDKLKNNEITSDDEEIIDILSKVIDEIFNNYSIFLGENTICKIIIENDCVVFLDPNTEEIFKKFKKELKNYYDDNIEKESYFSSSLSNEKILSIIADDDNLSRKFRALFRNKSKNMGEVLGKYEVDGDLVLGFRDSSSIAKNLITDNAKNLEKIFSEFRGFVIKNKKYIKNKYIDKKEEEKFIDIFSKLKRYGSFDKSYYASEISTLIADFLYLLKRGEIDNLDFKNKFEKMIFQIKEELDFVSNLYDSILENKSKLKNFLELNYKNNFDYDYLLSQHNQINDFIKKLGDIKNFITNEFSKYNNVDFKNNNVDIEEIIGKFKTILN